MIYAQLDAHGVVVEYPVTRSTIESRFPSTSFPEPFDPPAEYIPVVQSPIPACHYFQQVIEGELVEIDGIYHQTWETVPATAAVIAQRTEAQASAMRAKRTTLLNQCDWTQLPDAGLDPLPWRTYRQALRDLPNQPGFPWNLVWPWSPNSGWNPPTDPIRGDTYTAPDGSQWEWNQPRNLDGTYTTDNPDTPESESALQWLPLVVVT